MNSDDRAVRILAQLSNPRIGPYIRAAVDAAPPFTPEQIAALRVLLAPALERVRCQQ